MSTVAYNVTKKYARMNRKQLRYKWSKSATKLQTGITVCTYVCTLRANESNVSNEVIILYIYVYSNELIVQVRIHM